MYGIRAANVFPMFDFEIFHLQRLGDLFFEFLEGRS